MKDDENFIKHLNKSKQRHLIHLTPITGKLTATRKVVISEQLRPMAYTIPYGA